VKTITQKEEQHAAACCSETKNRYICISEESEGSYPDTLFETLPSGGIGTVPIDSKTTSPTRTADAVLVDL